jgi:hypothetical protein
MAFTAAASLPEAKGEAFESLSPFLRVSESVVEMLPDYFVVERARASVDGGTLHKLAVAGKLVYAHIRWLDELADQSSSQAHNIFAHPLNDSLFDLIGETFADALDASITSTFFANLAHHYACYSASLALERGSFENAASVMPIEQYLRHAKARAIPMRAPVDAVLLLTDATDSEAQRARSSFESCAAALQLLDDALDVEEDYQDGRLSWVVQRTISSCTVNDDHLPDPDVFYRTALLEGILVQSLVQAEHLFHQAAKPIQHHFSGWALYCDEMRDTTRKLRHRYESLVTNAG